MGVEQIRRVEQMPVYALFYKLALEVEKSTRSFKPDFRWLRGQCLRSSESVCANMTEGFYSQYSTEYLQALYRCRREARETMFHLGYAADAGQISATCAHTLLPSYENALMQLGHLILSIEKKISDRGKGKTMPNLVKEDSADYDIRSDPAIEYEPLPIDP